LVVGALLLRAPRRLEIRCLTVFVAQDRVSTLSNISRRHTFFAKYWWQHLL